MIMKDVSIGAYSSGIFVHVYSGGEGPVHSPALCSVLRVKHTHRE